MKQELKEDVRNLQVQIGSSVFLQPKLDPQCEFLGLLTAAVDKAMESEPVKAVRALLDTIVERAGGKITAIVSHYGLWQPIVETCIDVAGGFSSVVVINVLLDCLSSGMVLFADFSSNHSIGQPHILECVVCYQFNGSME